MKGLKRFKKIISGVLAAVLLVPACHPLCAFADESDGLREAIVKVKSIIDIPDYLSEFNSQKYSVGNGVEYRLSWSRKKADSAGENGNAFDEKYSSINVSVNDKGDIESYTMYSDYGSDRRKKLAGLSDEEYKQAAINKISEISPSIQSEYEFCKMYNYIDSRDVEVIFKRMKNGSEYCGNSINIRLDKETGEVTSYRVNHLYTSDAPDKGSSLSEENRRASFLEQSGGFDKIYITKGDTKTAVLVYKPKNSYIKLDAHTGREPELTEAEKKRIEEDKVFYRTENTMADMSMYQGAAEDGAVSGGGGASSAALAQNQKVELSESEISEVEGYSNLISPENAEKLIRGIENTVIDECELSHYRYFKRSERSSPMPIPVPMNNSEYDGADSAGTVRDVYYAEFSFEKEFDDKDGFIDATVLINAETGALERFFASAYYPNEDKLTCMDSGAAEGKALEFIKKYSPNEAYKAKNFGDEKRDVYRFEFNEAVNGIRYTDNSIYVRVNPYNGKIMEFSRNWTDGIKFESAEGIISESEAADILFEKAGFREYYENIAYVEYAPAVRLVYELKNELYPYYISASSGKFLDYNGEEKTEYNNEGNNLEFTDIDDYFAKDMINELVRNGVISVDSERKFRPNDSLTYSELEEMLERLNCRPLYYRWSPSRSILDEISRKGYLTRLEAVIYIVESVDYGKAARLKGVYGSGFSDADKIPAERLGYAMVVKGLGIVNGDENGCFNSEQLVTRGEAAVMIYNLLISEVME